MNYASIKWHDIANGEGVRVSLFVSGCRRHCKGCFNSEAWDFDYGEKFTDQTIKEICTAASPEYISGISILGGEPMDPDNVLHVLRFVNQYRIHLWHVRKKKTIWLYSSYTFEELLERTNCVSVLKSIDVLVDGPYVEELRDLTLPFRGSSNQRIIDVKKSIAQDKVVLWTPQGEKA